MAAAGGSLTRPATAQPPPPSQYDVQAVYLFDFAKFVRWPEGAGHESINLCIAGQRQYADTLQKIVTGEAIDGRPLAVRTILRPEDESGCSILFIGAMEQDRVDALLTAASGKPMLTVSDMSAFLDHGGMIQFLVLQKRVRFSVNLKAVQQSGLSLDSELLKVAVAVNGKSPDGGAL
jgi:hypothetical protein